jgi:hypothetical protein
MQAASQSSTPAGPSKTPTKTAQIRAIKQAYSELVALNLQDGFRDVASLLFDRNREAEYGHRRFRPDHVRCGLSVNHSAKLFTVQHLLEGFAEPSKYTVDDILCIRSEVLYAQAYAKRFHTELGPWARKWSPAFTRVDGVLQIDYAVLMKA